MKLPRRRFLHLAAGAAALPLTSRLAHAQAYPTKPVRIIVGFAAGGSVDLFARLIGQWLSERLGQPFIIENRPGAGGNIGTEAVVRAAPDGYTLLLVTAANAINESLFDKLNFNFIRDITPIATIHRGIGVMIVNPSFPIRSVPELIAYAKANPGKMNMGSGGNGSAQHIYGEYFKMMAGVDMLHVPYRGTPAALTALVAGEVQVLDRTDQSRNASRTRSDCFNTVGGAARYSNSGPIRTRLRGDCLARNGGAAEYALRNHRNCKQGGQRGAR
jgi:tripartite-type tricarboxylate transporter receptor subunit TctC